ncbi:MAG: hypothetical protein M3Z96_11415 [Pseudomonadota bacterium]|nr:hypothetical protein [Pseudomonadota bacterium]
MTRSIDGIYAAYLSGQAGRGFAMLLFRKGKIVGADSVGTLFDGSYSDHSTGYDFELQVKLPPNSPLIQGGTIGPYPELNVVNAILPADFLSLEFIRIDGKHGPVNVKLVLVREIDD